MALQLLCDMIYYILVIHTHELKCQEKGIAINIALVLQGLMTILAMIPKDKEALGHMALRTSEEKRVTNQKHRKLRILISSKRRKIVMS